MNSEWPTERKPQLLLEEMGICPICGKKTLKVSVYLYEVSYFGKILLFSGECSSCGYKYRDVRLAESQAPRKIIVRVEGERQLRYLLIKSAATAVIIKEREYEMVPGPASTGFITTVEGILHRFKEALNVICGGEGAGSTVCEEEREWLDRAIEGKEKFTMILCDYEGGSAVKGEKEYVTVEPLDEDCEKRRPEWLDRFILQLG